MIMYDEELEEVIICKRTDKMCYCETECECRDCGECEYNERMDEDPESEFEKYKCMFADAACEEKNCEDCEMYLKEGDEDADI